MSRKYLIAASIPSLAAFFVLLPCINNGFVLWDDGRLVFENEHIRAFDMSMLKWAFTSVAIASWYPVTIISFALDHTVWGLNPRGYHLTNLILHTVNTLLVFTITLRLIRLAYQNSGLPASQQKESDPALLPSCIVATLFAIHPLHVESVVWIAERKDMLYSLFYLSSLLAYISYCNEKVTGRRLYYLASLLFFSLSLMSKAMSVTLPAVLLLLDFFPLKRDILKKDNILEKVPFFFLSLALSALTIATHKSLGALVPDEVFSISEKIFISFHAYLFYLYKMVLPYNLAPLYPNPENVDFLSLKYLGSAIVVTATSICAVLTVKRQRFFTSLWFYYLVTLLPVIGILKVGPHSGADRYTYLPSLGPFILFSLAITWILKRYPGKKSGYPLTAALLTCSILLSMKTTAQIKIWKDTFSLWDHQIKIYPDAVPLAYYNRGLIFYNQGSYTRAVNDFTDAIRINPEKKDAYLNRGVAYGRMGRFKEAAQDFTSLLRLDPYSAEAYNNRGLAYKSLNRFRQALSDFEKAILADPKYGTPYFNMGALLTDTGEFKQAEKMFSKAEALGIKGGKEYLNNAIATFKNQNP